MESKKEQVKKIADIISSGQAAAAVRTGRNFVTVEAAKEIAEEIYHQGYRKSPN